MKARPVKVSSSIASQILDVKRDEHFKMPVAVHLVLVQSNDVLLLLRQGTGFADGSYSVVAGHLDGHESATDAMVREAYEEAGIIIDPQDLKFSCVMHRISPEREGVDFFYLCKIWKNDIVNKEPHKCGELRFYPLSQLPQNMVPYVKEGISRTFLEQSYYEFGWNNK
jgi:8-oxo-dGTP pyrophosphatase MutT (NUDIX family)